MLLVILSLLLVSSTAWAQDNPTDKPYEWPVLKTYAGENLSEVAMPLGGIGTGTVSIGGRGDLRDWELGNRGALGWTPGVKLVEPTIANAPFFALYFLRFTLNKQARTKASFVYWKGPSQSRNIMATGDVMCTMQVSPDLKRPNLKLPILWHNLVSNTKTYL